MQGTTDGALLILPEESAEELSALHAHGYRFVIVDPRSALDEQVPTVSRGACRRRGEAVEHLIGLGHRRIAAITGPTRLDGDRGAAVRLPGHAAAAGDRSEPGAGDRIRLPRRRRRSARPTSYWTLEHPPTAIFAFNDMLAIGAMQAARRAWHQLPQELSVIGFDDTFEASIVAPRSQQCAAAGEMGRMASRCSCGCCTTSASKRCTSSSARAWCCEARRRRRTPRR